MYNDGLRVENNKVVLCGNNVCCPKLEQLPDGRFKLTDDDGNFCIITAEQASLINPAVNKCQTLKEHLILG